MQPLKASERPTVSFYGIPPIEDEISLDEFENFALERLRVLSMVETKQGKEMVEKLEELAMKTHLNLASLENVRKDCISHWVLRLAVSKNEDLRNRFLNFESLLFKYRFEKQGLAQIESFMEENEVSFSVFVTI